MNGRLEKDIKTEQTINEKLSTMPDYVSEWDLNLKASQKTTATRINYIRQVANFLQFVNTDIRDVKLNQLDIIQVQKYFVSIQTKQKGNDIVETSDSYRCMTWACLNNFFNYMMKRGYINENPILIIEKPKNHDLARINQTRKLLTDKDFRKILQAVEDDLTMDWKYKDRNKLILMLFMTTGMRKTALIEINVEDIDVESKMIKIIDKRKKTHVYPLNDDVMEVLDDWMFRRQRLLQHNNINSDALFINKYMQRMGKDAVEDVVARYSQKALGYKISPHKLRAGCASILYNKTHDLEFVRRAIGHADVSTTTRYIVTQGKEREEMSEIMRNVLNK